MLTRFVPFRAQQSVDQHQERVEMMTHHVTHPRRARDRFGRDVTPLTSLGSGDVGANESRNDASEKARLWRPPVAPQRFDAHARRRHVICS